MRKNYTSPLFEELDLGTENVLLAVSEEMDNLNGGNGSIDDKVDTEDGNLF